MNNNEQNQKNPQAWVKPKDERTIEIEIPIGFMNCGITICNHFIADTNDSAKWDTLKFPLPNPIYQWNISYYCGDIDNPNKQTVVLIDKA